MTQGIEYLGNFRWDLAACLICAWIMIYFAVWKSVKSSGKLVYFTATLPYVIIIALTIRCVTLEGADVGLAYLFNPKWELLADATVWVNAAGQVFNSIGLAIGCVVSVASYNKSSRHLLADTLSVTLINVFTSLLVGVFAFATIGNIATEQRIPVDEVITDGPGLVFEVYPQAMAKMPASQAWAVSFFFMLLCVGLNSQFAIVEVVVTSIQDGFPNWMKKHFVCHEVLVFVVCMVSFCFALPNIFQNGIYFFQLVDHYAASISIMYLAFFEVIAVAWFYGIKRLSKNIKDLTGEVPSIYFRFCWCCAAPVFLLSIWIFGLIDYTPPTYNNGSYNYPKWAEAIGWVIASLSLACIPVYAVYVFVTTQGNTIGAKMKNAVTPHLYQCDICEVDKCEHITELPGNMKELEVLLDDQKPNPKILPAAEINRR